MTQEGFFGYGRLLPMSHPACLEVATKQRDKEVLLSLLPQVPPNDFVDSCLRILIEQEDVSFLSWIFEHLNPTPSLWDHVQKIALKGRHFGVFCWTVQMTSKVSPRDIEQIMRQGHLVTLKWLRKAGVDFIPFFAFAISKCAREVIEWIIQSAPCSEAFLDVFDPIETAIASHRSVDILDGVYSCLEKTWRMKLKIYSGVGKLVPKINHPDAFGIWEWLIQHSPSKTLHPSLYFGVATSNQSEHQMLSQFQWLWDHGIHPISSAMYVSAMLSNPAPLQWLIDHDCQWGWDFKLPREVFERDTFPRVLRGAAYLAFLHGAQLSTHSDGSWLLRCLWSLREMSAKNWSSRDEWPWRAEPSSWAEFRVAMVRRPEFVLPRMVEGWKGFVKTQRQVTATFMTPDLAAVTETFL